MTKEITDYLKFMNLAIGWEDEKKKENPEVATPLRDLMEELKLAQPIKEEK